MKKFALVFSLLLCALSSHAQLVVNGARAFPQANDGTTGTTVNLLAKINTSGNAIKAGTGDTAVPTYIVVGGAGTSGNAAMANYGLASCVMDTTLASGAGGDFVVASTSTAGDCHPQSGAPGAGTWVIGYLVGSSTTAASAALVEADGYVYGGTGGGGSFGGTNTQTASYTLAAGDNGKLVVMNCSAVCTLTLPAAQPSTTFAAWVMTVNANASLALGGTDTWNGGSSVPSFAPFRAIQIRADSATATNYVGNPPLTSTATMFSLTQSANSLALSDGPLAYDGTSIVTFTPASGTSTTIQAPSGDSFTLASQGSGNVSLNAKGSGNVSLTATSNAKHIVANSGIQHSEITVAFSATPTFNAGASDTFEITLTGNVTSSTLSNPGAGEHLTFTICQDATGGRTFAWPSGFRGQGTIGSTASTCSTQRFWYDGTNFFAVAGMITGE